MSDHICGQSGKRERSVPCVVCEVIEDAQEKAWDKGWCGSARSGLVCDRESGHKGQHRGYWSEHDAVLFWGKA